MKRDMDLVRELLLRIEAVHIPAGRFIGLPFDKPPLRVGEESVDEIANTIRLLRNAAFFELTDTQPVMPLGLFGLSWKGHDFLDSVRDPKIWHETKEGAKKAGGFTVELLGELAKGLIKTQIKKHTGVEL